MKLGYVDPTSCRFRVDQQKSNKGQIPDYPYPPRRHHAQNNHCGEALERLKSPLEVEEVFFFYCKTDEIEFLDRSP